jgi:hypothetical protein
MRNLLLRWLLRTDGALDEVLRLPNVPERLKKRIIQLQMEEDLRTERLLTEWRSACLRQLRAWRGQA